MAQSTLPITLSTTLPDGLVQTLFKQTATVTIANTTTETSLFGAGVGTLTILGNSLSVGDMIEVELAGTYKANLSAGRTVRVKLGSVVIASLITSSAGVTANARWRALFLLTCRSVGASGTVMGQGGFDYRDMDNDQGRFDQSQSTTAQTVDLTADQSIDVTFEHDAADADDSIKCTNAAITYLGGSAVPVPQGTFAQNRVLASPDGSTGGLSVRALVVADLPAITAQTISTNTTLDATHVGKLLLLDTSGGSFDLTLPAANGAVVGPFIACHRINGGTVRWQAAGSDEVGLGGNTHPAVQDYWTMTVVSDGTSRWLVTAQVDNSAI